MAFIRGEAVPHIIVPLLQIDSAFSFTGSWTRGASLIECHKNASLVVIVRNDYFIMYALTSLTVRIAKIPSNQLRAMHTNIVKRQAALQPQPLEGNSFLGSDPVALPSSN